MSTESTASASAIADHDEPPASNAVKDNEPTLWEQVSAHDDDATGRMKRLLEMEKEQDIELRSGREVKLGRPSYQELVLGTGVGRVASTTKVCRPCKNGNGPFLHCITVPNEFKGSCTNCNYSSSANRCNLRKELSSRNTLQKIRKDDIPTRNFPEPRAILFAKRQRYIASAMRYLQDCQDANAEDYERLQAAMGVTEED
ncbi:MAG: hypothetical protein M4579_007528 [Chaenotheca gracillima]|nr:MAG: hypothetical protein M4579_007528 [Chaenotheca gracillima]